LSEHKRLGAKTRALTLVVILSNALGNFSLNWGMKHSAAQFSFNPLSILRLIFSPWVALGIALLIVWMLSRMALLSWADLSYVLPVTALGYILSALIGRYFFYEVVTPLRWAGIGLIVLGIVLVGSTQHATTLGEPVL
jgi:uncharacterized membrane protein